MSLNAPEGLKGSFQHDSTPDELREFLNAPAVSADHFYPVEGGKEGFALSMANMTAPVVEKEEHEAEETAHTCPKETQTPLSTTSKPSAVSNIAFQFDGNCHEDTLDTSSDLHHFRFRCASDPTSLKTELATMSQPSGEPAYVFGCVAESQPAPRRVSDPASTQAASVKCFLQLTGETLEQFIAGVGVEESKLENKKVWLLQLQSLESAYYLGRWPSPAKLQEFMDQHNLVWPVRVSGKWDLSSKSFGEREALKTEILDKLFAAAIDCNTASSAEDEVEEVDSSMVVNANIDDGLEAKVASSYAGLGDNDTTADQSAPELSHVYQALQIEDDILIDEETERNSGRDNLGHVFVWLQPGEIAQNCDAQEQKVTAEELGQDLTHENLSHVFVWLQPGEVALDSAARAEALSANLGSQDADLASTAQDVNDCNPLAQVECASPVEVSVDAIVVTELADKVKSETSEEDAVEANQDPSVHDSSDKTSMPKNFDTETDDFGSAEADSNPAKNDLEICDINGKSETHGDLHFEVPIIVLTLPDGTEADIETIPWKRRRRGRGLANDPLRLAPPPRPRKPSKRHRSPGPLCDLPGCERCAKVLKKKEEESIVQTEIVKTAKHNVEPSEAVVKKAETNPQEKAEEKAVVEFTKSSASVAKSNTMPEIRSQELEEAEGLMDKVTTEMPAGESLLKDRGAMLAFPVFANINESTTSSTDHNPAARTIPSAENEKPAHTVPKWSIAPIVASMALSTLYVSARCPLLPAFAIMLGSISLKSSLGR